MPDSISDDNWEVGKSLRYIYIYIYNIYIYIYIYIYLALCLTVIVESTHDVDYIVPVSVGKS